MGVTTRKKKKKTAKHGYSTRGGADNEEDTATNRLTTKALYDTEDEEEVWMLIPCMGDKEIHIFAWV